MKLKVKAKDSKFKFKCKKCGFCCDHTMIQLYPFDIYGLCKELEISTPEFHNKYSKFMIDNQGIPRCILANQPKCPFKEKDKCTIYEARPVRCRLFPVGRIFEEKIEYVLPEQQCIGFDTGHKQTISQYLTEQGVDETDDITLRWNNFVINLKNKEITKNSLFPIMFRKIFYDFDDKLITSYRNKLGEENNQEQLMEKLYQISETLFKNI